MLVEVSYQVQPHAAKWLAAIGNPDHATHCRVIFYQHNETVQVALCNRNKGKHLTANVTIKASYFEGANRLQVAETIGELLADFSEVMR